MRNIIAITQREMRSYFASPVAYIVTAFFLIIAGLLFSLSIAQTQQATMRYVFADLSTIWLFITPALTMRLLAEEQRSGTIEMLMTSPVRDVEVTLGKYLAALSMVAVMIVLTLEMPLLLVMHGSPDRGPLLAGYLGLLLQAGAFLSIGLLASSLTQNQIVAAIVTFGVLLVLWLSDFLADMVSGIGGNALRFLAVSPHLQDMPSGVIDTKDLVYFLSIAAAGIFLTMISLQVRRWR